MKKETKIKYGDWKWMMFCASCNKMCCPKVAVDQDLCWNRGHHSKDGTSVFTIKKIVREKTLLVKKRFFFTKIWEVVPPSTIDFKEDDNEKD